MESNSSSRSSPSSYSVVSEASVIPPGQFVFKDTNFEVSFTFDFFMLSLCCLVLELSWCIKCNRTLHDHGCNGMMGNQDKMVGKSKVCMLIESQLILTNWIYLSLFL